RHLSTDRAIGHGGTPGLAELFGVEPWLYARDRSGLRAAVAGIFDAPLPDRRLVTGGLGPGRNVIREPDAAGGAPRRWSAAERLVGFSELRRAFADVRSSL